MTQSSWEPLSARLVEVLEAVPAIGRVYDRQRLAWKGRDLEELFFTNIEGVQRLRTWVIDLGQAIATPIEAGGMVKWKRTVKIEGHLDFEDAHGSELVMVGLAELVQRALWADLRATRFNDTVLGGHPPSLVDKEPKSFAGITAGYVRLEMPVFTLESP